MANHENTLILRQRHSLAHILAQAVQREQQADVEVGIGPSIDNGFYYDFLFSAEHQLKEEDLVKIQKQMDKIVKENQDFIVVEMDDTDSKELVTQVMKQKYKEEMRSEFVSGGEKITFYTNTIHAGAKDKVLAGINPEYLKYYEGVTAFLGAKYPELYKDKFITFLDMCEGPHVENTKEVVVGAFMLDKIAGAYWRGDEKNIMMIRIYGLAFESKDELKAYQTMMEEARKRDHRVLGAKLKLFTISQLVGAGLPLLQPNGMVIKKELEDYLRDLHKNKGYSRVWTPHITKKELYATSGHLEKFGEDLFHVKGGSSSEEFCLKPMNCPHHMQIFADNQFSYRDMPIRYFEPATVYRDEKPGQLGGLTRVRSITQDDGHLFCRIGQIGQEVSTIVGVIKSFYTTMGMLEGYRVRLSVRGPEGKYLGSDEAREQAEGALRKSCEENELPFKVGVGEAAFYGPKLDFMFKDAIGRERQLSTIQCDFQLPERFNLSYVNEEGLDERPVVIHRAIAGSFERFMGVMIENFAGAFPLRLAPTQFQIVPVAEKFNDYAAKIAEKLKSESFRVKIDDGTDSFSKKIRNAELMKVPYILIVGEKEETDDTVSVRVFKTKEQLTLGVKEFIEEKVVEYKERRL